MGEFVASLDEPAYRAEQIIKWIHQYGVTDIAEMTNLSKKLREKLMNSAEVVPPAAMLEKLSKDGTSKWLLKLPDTNAIEAVYIPEKTRATLCVSSQVGCALNCSFCATGKEGFNRNLSLAEIIGQVWYAVRRVSELGLQKVTNVVMMGMGEPLLNYQPVVDAMDLMMSDIAYGLSKYRVTLSTSGVVPMMNQLKQDSQAALAVSLHAPTDELRNKLVPINKKYPLSVLMATCRDYFPSTSKRTVTFEYVMLKGVNDQLEQADQLIKLLDGMPCKMNLIPFNPFARANYQRSTDTDIDNFQRRLIDAGISTWVRRTRGDDIDGACGQLAGEFKDRTGRHERWLKTGKLTPTPST